MIQLHTRVRLRNTEKRGRVTNPDVWIDIAGRVRVNWDDGDITVVPRGYLEELLTERVRHPIRGLGTRYNGDVTRIEWDNGRTSVGSEPNCEVVPDCGT